MFAMNLTGCGEMIKPYTFSITVQASSETMSEQDVMDLVVHNVEYEAGINVLNIVRDY
jgi:hypothetical protein